MRYALCARWSECLRILCEDNSQVKTFSHHQAVFVTEAHAPLSHGGGSMSLHCDVMALKEMGYQITLVHWRNYDSPAKSLSNHQNIFKDVTVVDLSQQVPDVQTRDGDSKPLCLSKILSKFGVVNMYANAYADAVEALVNRIKPEIVIVNSYPALVALRKVTAAPILFEMELFPSHLHYLSLIYRVMPGLTGVRKALALARFPVTYVSLKIQEIALAQISTYIAALDPRQAKFTAKKLRRTVSVYRCPVIDQVTNRQFMRHRDKKKIIMVGQLRGLVSLCSFEYLSKHLIDRMRVEIKEPFELHIIGGYELPGRFQHLRDCEGVVFRGHIDDIEPEFRTADVVLSTSTFDFGSSTRLRSALVFGSVLVAHRNSSQGIPELRHEYNALLCETPDDFIHNIQRCFVDQNLCETLGQNARATYEKFFSLEAHRKQMELLIATTLEQYRVQANKKKRSA
jgi:glycosyltransferase involved in cell wall biosynthesis